MTLRRIATVAAGLSLVAVALGSCVSNPSQSPDPSTIQTRATTEPTRLEPPKPAASVMTIKLDGREVEIGQLSDCVAISNSFLRAWCDATFTGRLPTDPSKMTSSDFPVIYAALARAMIADDVGICSDPVIMRFVSVGSHVADGKGACESSFKTLWSRGYFSVSDPSTGETIEVPLK
jgi:hypothetical protein